jgi:twitching motility protein PilT
MVDYINRTRKGHILTIEDPIEFVHLPKHCMINQREVGPQTHSFANALRSALREDPDVILVGEMRDRETISLAITAAETGHVVFGTLHTNSASKTIDRIINVYPAEEQGQVRAMLAESLAGVIAQRLLPRVGGGRVAALEILIASSAVRAMIRDGKTYQLPNAIQTGRSCGMQSFEQHIHALAAARQITSETARKETGAEAPPPAAPADAAGAGPPGPPGAGPAGPPGAGPPGPSGARPPGPPGARAPGPPGRRPPGSSEPKPGPAGGPPPAPPAADGKATRRSFWNRG